MAYLYKVTNSINYKFYYGVHSLNDDNYFGSGLLIKKAIKTHGKHNFYKTILFEGTTKECYELEEFILSIDFINNPKCYNLALGGNGGLLLTGEKLVEFKENLKKRNSERIWTKEQRLKISNANKGKASPFKGSIRENKGVGTGRQKGCIPWNKGIKQKDYDKKEI